MRTCTLEEIEEALESGRLEVRTSHGQWWRARRNGKTRTWKTRPGEFLVPVKAGLRATGQITHESPMGEHGVARILTEH